MKAYKGFNQDMTCTPVPGVKFQFEEGKTYEEPTADLCNSGFHACEDPLDCFGYYPPSSSVYHVVELEDVSENRENDSKVCGKRISIGARIDLASIIKASVDLRFSKVEKAKRKTNSGDRGAATNSGDRGAATNSGYQGAATNSGEEGVAINLGIDGRVMGALHTWIVCDEWELRNGGWHRVNLKSAYVDGETIKPDTWYRLEHGEFVEVKV